MNHKKSAPTRVDFDFSDSDEDDEEEFEVTPPSPLHQHHAIVEGVAAGIALKKHHDEKMADHQDTISPVDQEQEEKELGQHDVSAIAGDVCTAIDVDTTCSESSIEHNHNQDENKTMEESKLGEQNVTSPVDAVDDQKQAKKEPQGHHPSVPIAGGTSSTPVKEDKEIVFKWFNHPSSRVNGRLEQGGDNVMSEIDHITMDPREEEHVIIKDSKDKDNDGCAANGKPNDELNDEFDNVIAEVHESVLGKVTEVETIVKYSKDKDNKGWAANEMPNAELKDELNDGIGNVIVEVHESVLGKVAEVETITKKTTEVELDNPDTTNPVDTVDNQEQENKKTRRHYFHRHSNHPHHPHLGAIADHVSSTVHAIATGIGIKRHQHKTPKTTADLSPSPSITTTSSITTAEAPKPPHFEIVLVNIKKAAEERHIYCEKKHLDDELPYVALSYRWGELDEQIVPATKDYYARIVSFHLDDFFKLCQAMQYEPDLQHIEYVWVDAICVDQENMEKRKATIYRMNEIYIHAAAIVAVPDLHAYHIATTTTANSAVMDTIEGYRCYLYYLLVGTPEAQQSLVEIDNAWMDKLGMPTSDSQRRDLILTANATTTTTTATTTTTTTTAMTNHLNRGIGSLSFTQQLMAFVANPGGVMASTVDALNVKDNDIQDRELPSRMIMEVQRFEWQQQLNQRQTDICQSVRFLQSIMEDWSNRTWVISEYHIAKRLTGKLKFWYNQLSCPELYGQRFFEFKFKKTKKRTTTGDHDINHGSSLQSSPYTKQIIELTSHFNASMDRRLSSRSVLEMMLQTKASKVEDRFHAIIPLAKKYKRYIKDRQSISNLGVSDMLSVRLKLMEWSDTKDRLVLLFSEQRLASSAVPFLPTFATHFKAIPPRLTKFLTDNSSSCNFDVTTEKEENDDDDEGDEGDDQDGNSNNTNGDDGDVRLVRTGTLNELWLRPRMYCERQVKPHGKSFFNNLWQDLGIDPTQDRLDAVSIPLFINDGDMKKNSLWTLDLQLLGSWEKNVWIMYPFDTNVKEIKMRPMDYQKQTLPQGFRVY